MTEPMKKLRRLRNPAKCKPRSKGEKLTAYQRRVKERDEVRERLSSLQRQVWCLRQAARHGMMMGVEISPFCDIEGNEEGPRLNETQLRESILNVRIF